MLLFRPPDIAGWQSREWNKKIEQEGSRKDASLSI
jgi:hypothetical protein